ncbi:MAG: ATP phosphoribosyltransferase [Thermoflexales bacterium]|nr:ATP phosphoribosyltransferase [Thermoflexales bacterium]MCS7324341.1 ATP phosphoribosyltransferase [Thermoflexales bacterium]MCX7939457.1 ATP phosphoribosyltransferase [Thermoflexales bacterium]MDW8054842.1 ATP phosphoribosyltransferase [Anaerolineae bacterium]MDW8293047.1 ATP phosphoribosyltransferase [Anaerolineae bacterium]
MRTDIRLALPSKGRLQQPTLEFLARCGFEVKPSATRGYIGSIPALPQLTVLFQRPRDIIVSVAGGGVDFGITGFDVIAEAQADEHIYVLHDALGYGKCRLVLAVPEQWEDVQNMHDLRVKASQMPHPLRVVTKYRYLTQRFLETNGVQPFALVDAEGSLEVVPEIGYADVIVDVAETGATLQQNRLRVPQGGVILHSQASLVANRASLRRPEVMAVAIELLEYIEAHQRAEGYFMVWANVRGESLESVGRLITEQTTLGGLQGPTIAPIYPNPTSAAAHPHTRWFAVNVVVGRHHLTEAIEQLRAIGGSGVVVTPTTYIFEEQPSRVAALRALHQTLRPA